MTGVTDIRCINVVRGFTGSRYAIVTAETGTNHLTMINCTTGHRNPWRWTRLMTGIAQICCIDVVHRLTAGGGSIMAADTGTNHLRMVNGAGR